MKSKTLLVIVLILLSIFFVSCREKENRSIGEFIGEEVEEVVDAQEVQESVDYSEYETEEVQDPVYPDSNMIVKHFDPDNKKVYWVAKWNTPSYFSSDYSWDGILWDGYVFEGTRIDTVVYFIFEWQGESVEKCFHVKNLCTDPRGSSWWQSTVFDIYRNDDIKDIEEAVRECSCIRDFPNEKQEQIVSSIIEEMENLGFWDPGMSNVGTFDMGVALLRYTWKYHGKSLNYEKAARLIHG